MGRGSRSDTNASRLTLREQLRRGDRQATAASWRPDYVTDTIARRTSALLGDPGDTPLSFADSDTYDTVEHAWRSLHDLVGDLQRRAADDPGQAAAVRDLRCAVDDLQDALQDAFDAGCHGMGNYAEADERLAGALSRLRSLSNSR